MQAKDHIAKAELNQEENDCHHQKWPQIVTHVLWSLTSIIIYAGSLILMSLLGYIEMFSNSLMASGFQLNICLLPFLILLLNIPVNVVLYKLFINNKDSFSLAHAILSPIKPCRYLHYDDINRTKKFLIGNQVAIWLSHICAWLAYSLLIYVKYDKEDTGFFRLFPVLAATVTIPPLFAIIHWSVSIEPSYGFVVNKEIDKDSIKSLKGQTCKLQIFWQLTTLITRCVSLGLLSYVYYEHWLEVGWTSVKLAVVETLPLLVILVLGNIAIQFMYHLGSVPEGLFGTLLPNGYLKVRQFI